MGMTQTRWKPGQSGSPKGRPANPLIARPMADALRMLSLEFAENGSTEKRERLAHILWEAMETGVVTFRDGRMLEMKVKEWLDLVTWTFKHMEGTLRPASATESTLPEVQPAAAVLPPESAVPTGQDSNPEEQLPQAEQAKQAIPSTLTTDQLPAEPSPETPDHAPARQYVPYDQRAVDFLFKVRAERLAREATSADQQLWLPDAHYSTT